MCCRIVSSLSSAFASRASQKRLDVAQVGSALVEKEGGGRMPQGVSGNDWYPRALAGELEADVEGLIAKGRAVPARKGKPRSRKVDSSRPQPHPLDAFQESEPLLERFRQFSCEGQIAKRAAFDLEAGGDNHPSGLAHQPINGQKRPLMVSAAGKEEGTRQVIRQVAVVSCLYPHAIRAAVVRAAKRCSSAARFSPGRTLAHDTRQRVWRTEDVIEESQRGFDLEVMRGAFS